MNCKQCLASGMVLILVGLGCLAGFPSMLQAAGPAIQTDTAGEAIEDDFDDLLDQFGDSDLVSPESGTAETPSETNASDSKADYRIGGELSLSAAYNFAHDPPAPGQTDWRGLSRLRSMLAMEFDAEPSDAIADAVALQAADLLPGHLVEVAEHVGRQRAVGVATLPLGQDPHTRELKAEMGHLSLTNPVVIHHLTASIRNSLGKLIAQNGQQEKREQIMAKLSLEDLKKIKEQTAKSTYLRDGDANVKITVHMATCGIASGALATKDAFEQALRDFQTVIDEYPRSSKVPDALLKMGLCSYSLQRWEAARETLTRVQQEYAETTAARLAGQYLGRMDSEGV